MYLCLDNASRTGALANMSCKEFHRAKYENGSYKVAVLNHKTLATSGPCVIVFTAALFAETHRRFLHDFAIVSMELIPTKKNHLCSLLAGALSACLLQW